MPTGVLKHRTPRDVPQVKVYSRHRASCRKSESSNITCDCPKQICWYRDGKLHQISAGTCDGAVATEKAEKMQAGFKAAAYGTPTEEMERGKLLEEAINDFIESTQQKGVTEKHVNKCRFQLGEFLTFCHGRGLVNLGDVKTEHVLQWRNALTGHQNTKAKKVFRVIGFFTFCVEMGWIARNVAQVRTVVIPYSDEQEPKALNDAQFDQLLASVPKVNGTTTDEERRKLRSLVLLMRYTGLAIKDASLIERSRFKKNGHGFWSLFLWRAKTGHDVFCTIPGDITDEILAGANAKGRYLFVESVPTKEREVNNLVKTWGDLMSKLGKVADLKDEHNDSWHFTSHQLRHTFVYQCLNAGLPTEDIAALIGDTVQVVAKYYSRWITGRQERLNERMMLMYKGQ